VSNVHPEEMAKSSLNSHMEQKHQLKNFNRLLKQSYIPDASIHSVDKGKRPKTTSVQTYEDPLSFEPEDSRNNNDNIDYIKEEMNIKQEWTKTFIKTYWMYMYDLDYRLY
jgi:hypothetical protein